MTFEALLEELDNHIRQRPEDTLATVEVIDWVKKYREFAFVKANLEGHLTGSMIITNPQKTKVLLMLHKKFQRWQQFGGHCDGEVDVRNVALREFYEESGISLPPKLYPDILHIDVHQVPVDAKGTPAHLHFDILYLGIIAEDTLFSRQESEVDDIRWFDLDEALRYNNEHLMQSALNKIRNLQ